MDETDIYGLPYMVSKSDSGLSQNDKDSDCIPLIFATHDPLYAMAHTLRNRLPDADMFFIGDMDEQALLEYHFIFFTLHDEHGNNVTYEEWGKPLVLFEVDPLDDNTFLRSANGKIHLATEWMITGNTKAKALAYFRNMHELVMSGIQIYTAPASLIDMSRQAIEDRRKGWDNKDISFDLWARMMGKYIHPYDSIKREKLNDDFKSASGRRALTEAGVLTHLNPQLAGPLPSNSHVPDVLNLRHRLNTAIQRIYTPNPE